MVQNSPSHASIEFQDLPWISAGLISSVPSGLLCPCMVSLFYATQIDEKSTSLPRCSPSWNTYTPSLEAFLRVVDYAEESGIQGRWRNNARLFKGNVGHLPVLTCQWPERVLWSTSLTPLFCLQLSTFEKTEPKTKPNTNFSCCLLLRSLTISLYCEVSCCPLCPSSLWSPS